MPDSSSSTSDEQRDTAGTAVAHAARIYNYWLGGKDNYAVDRAVADQVIESFPDIVRSVRAGRAFLTRAVRYLVKEAGIRQFLDVGSGLPTANNTHNVAQSLAPECRIVYVDNDPLVLTHARALLTSSPEGATDIIMADAQDTDGILRAAGSTLDFNKPVAIMLLSILSFIADDQEASAIVRSLLDAVPVGSYLVISHLVGEVDAEGPDEPVQLQRSDEAVPGSITPRSLNEVTGFFQGLQLIDPGIVRCSEWRPEPGEPVDARVSQYGAVGRKVSGHVTGKELPEKASGAAPLVSGFSGSDDTSDRLTEISRLEYGWLDGEGQPVSQSVITLSFVVREKLAERRVVKPNIYPTIEGGVLFEWSRGPQELSIEVKPDLSIYLVQVHVVAGTITESTAEESSLSEAIDAMNGMV